ncbi:substance-P receptor isoform X2 [Aethina tumida]|uniref:substance-P receptor isoform X2 n=1 Tax=Aethina tumida TaxID=116153 RepID=UPI0021473736|nr:substance-P receptor isoform X2 [Aethina tumida]
MSKQIPVHALNHEVWSCSRRIVLCISTTTSIMNYDYDYQDVDTSNSTFINTIWIIRELDYVIQRIAIFLPLVILGIYGNALVIYVLWKTPHIQTPTNLLIANMAVADLLSLLIHPWVFITYDIFQNYQLGTVGCHLEGSLECAILLSSVFSMSAITYDRLTAILLPRETRLSLKGAKIVMFVTWLAGLILSLPLVFYRTYKTRKWLNFVEKYCKENSMVLNIYWYVIITVLVWIPLSIQIICYVSIFIKLRKYEKVVIMKFEHHQVGYKKKAAKMMFVVTVIFMVCHLPFTGLIIYRHQLLKNNGMPADNNEVNYQNQNGGFYHNLWFTSKYLIFLNGAINPVIYGCTNEKYRKALRKSKLASWMFTNRRERSIIVTQKKVKPVDTTTKPTIFFIFKRKLKYDTATSNTQQET